VFPRRLLSRKLMRESRAERADGVRHRSRHFLPLAETRLGDDYKRSQPWHAVSTGDFGLFTRQAEIAWQNNDGTVGIWLVNGTTPTSEAAQANAGAAWQLISIDHFTPGAADLLFQNTSGAMGLWVTTGVTVAATLNLPNPGAGWQSENGHPMTLAG
jgi:hypothetical protein